MRLALKGTQLALKTLLLAVGYWMVTSCALATDVNTWKPADLWVKRHVYVGSHFLSGTPADQSGKSYYVLPTIAAGTGAGTSPTVSVSGNDAAGVVSVTTGTTPAASAVVATVTFGTAYPTNSFVVLEPANAATAALAVTAQAYVTSTKTSFALNTGSTGLTGSTAYKWNYLVLGN